MRQEYPKYMYHRELAPVVVDGPDEHEALGEEWKESPAHFVDVEEIPGGVVSSESASQHVSESADAEKAAKEEAAAKAKAEAKAKKEADASAAKAAAKAAKDAAKATKDAKK